MLFFRDVLFLLKYTPILSAWWRRCFGFVKGVCDRLSCWIQERIIINGGVVLYGEHEIHFPPGIGVGMATDIYWSSDAGYETETWNVLECITKNATDYIDVGAHIGLFAVAVKKASPHVRVYACEPLPQHEKRLRCMFQQNGLSQDRIFPYALSDKDGQGVLWVEDIPRMRRPELYETGISAVSLKHATDRLRLGPVTQQSIELRTADTIFAGHSLGDRIVWKIDVEGHELAVLRGANSILSARTSMCIVEMNQGSDQNIEVMQYIEKHDYEAFGITRDGLVRLTKDDVKRAFSFLNVLLIPRERAPIGNIVPVTSLSMW